MSTTEVRALFEDSIHRILGDQVTPAVLRNAEAGEWQAQLFGVLDQAGFARAMASEEFGGVGASWSDVFPIVFACGRHALPLALPESLAACWMLDNSGMQIPDGTLGIAQASSGTALSRQGGGWRLQGTLSGTPWGRAVDFVLTHVRHDGVDRLVLLNREAAIVIPDQNIAREARDRLEFNNAEVYALVPMPDAFPFDPIQTYGALVRSAQIAGAMDRIVNLCVQYANDRIQFGKPIGKFQAIQQQLAVLAADAASVTTAAEFAFAMAAQGEPAFATACAKIRAGEAAGKAAAIAHAVHGAIGFTYEHTLHYLTRRLWSWRSEFGTHAYWADKLGREVCAAGGAQVWPLITRTQIKD